MVVRGAQLSETTISGNANAAIMKREPVEKTTRKAGLDRSTAEYYNNSFTGTPPSRILSGRPACVLNSFEVPTPKHA